MISKIRNIRKPTRQQTVQFLFFNLGGVSFFVLGYLVFTICYGVLDMPWWISKLIADAAGATSNFFIQRYVTFRLEAKHINSRVLLSKFGILSVTNIIIDYAIVAGLNALGVSPFIGLIASATFFTVWKYVWYKLWVFRPRKKGDDSDDDLTLKA